MKRIKMGVIGVGNMGRNHVRILSRETNDCQLVGIYDANTAQAEKIAADYGTVPFQNMDTLLDNVEAVVVAVPSSLHMEIGWQVLKHKVHALIEKPLALSSHEAQELTQAFEANGCKLAVGHVERFNPVITELKKILQKEKIIEIETRRYSSFDPRISDANVVEDLMIHDIDLVNYLADGRTITSIQSNGRVVRSGKLDHVSSLFEFDNGVQANLSASRISQSKIRGLIVHTENYFLNANLLTRALTVYQNTNMIIGNGTENSYKQDSMIQRIFVPTLEPLREELLAFIHAVAQQKPVAVSGDMATVAIAICEKIISQCQSHCS